jgi:hypothetical protein
MNMIHMKPNRNLGCNPLSDAPYRKIYQPFFPVKQDARRVEEKYISIFKNKGDIQNCSNY